MKSPGFAHAEPGLFRTHGSDRSVADRDVAHADPTGTGDEGLLHDVALGAFGINRSVDAEMAEVVVVMLEAPGRGRGRSESDGAEGRGDAEGENELADHGGLSCLGDVAFTS